MFNVYDAKTNTLVGTYKKRITSTHKIDKLNNDYGAYRYYCVNETEPYEHMKIQNEQNYTYEYKG